MESSGFLLQFLAWHLALMAVLVGPRGSFWAALVVALLCLGTFFYDLFRERKIKYSGIMCALIIAENIMAIYYVKYMNGTFL